jgi:hypothetical protein
MHEASSSKALGMSSKGVVAQQKNALQGKAKRTEFVETLCFHSNAELSPPLEFP